MISRIYIDQIGAGGIPDRRLALFEAGTEREAFALATDEMNIGGPCRQRSAAVFIPSGMLVFAYVSRATVRIDDEGR